LKEIIGMGATQIWIIEALNYGFPLLIGKKLKDDFGYYRIALQRRKKQRNFIII
jgi:hypothetical protein